MVGTVRDDPLTSDQTHREGATSFLHLCPHSARALSGDLQNWPPSYNCTGSQTLQRWTLGTKSTWEPEPLSAPFSPQPSWSHPSCRPSWASLPFPWQVSLLPPKEGPWRVSECPAGASQSARTRYYWLYFLYLCQVLYFVCIRKGLREGLKRSWEWHLSWRSRSSDFEGYIVKYICSGQRKLTWI